MTSPRPPSPSALWPYLRIAGYGAVLLALGEVLLFRIRPESAWDVFDEYGTLEKAQLVCLGLGILLGLVTAVRYPASRPVSILLAGLLVAVLIREHNNYFKDRVGEGVWQIWVGVVIVVSVGVSACYRRNVWGALADLGRAPALAWMAAAVLLVVFGQLFDEHDLWAYMLEGVDPKAARRAVEECLELAGYYLFAVGLFEYWLYQRANSTA